MTSILSSELASRQGTVIYSHKSRARYYMYIQMCPFLKNNQGVTVTSGYNLGLRSKRSKDRFLVSPLEFLRDRVSPASKLQYD